MQGDIASPARSRCQLRFMQALIHESVHGFKFGDRGVTQVFFCDDGAFCSDSLAGLQMAFDAAWVAARVAGLDVRAKPEEATTRRGTKTAWMACYWDADGVEREITGYEMRTPLPRKVSMEQCAKRSVAPSCGTPRRRPNHVSEPAARPSIQNPGGHAGKLLARGTLAGKPAR